MFIHTERFDKLDKNKTYCGYSISNGLIGRRIQEHALNFMKRSRRGIILRKEDIAVHSYVLHYEDDRWYVYESRFRGGVQKNVAERSLSELDRNFLYVYNNTFFKVYANLLIEEGVGYSVRGIARHWLDKTISFFTEDYKNIRFIFGKPEGMFCTEYMDIITNLILSRHFGVHPHALIPAHQQIYAIEKNIKLIEL
jgi:hypothetical protein